MPKYRKVLLKKNDLELVLITSKITTGYKQYTFYSYLYLYTKSEILTHKPLFCPSSKAKCSHETALRKLGNDHEKTLSALIEQALDGVDRITEELARARDATSTI